MSDSKQQVLISKWLDQQLTEDERNEFEYLCLHDAAFAGLVETASRIAMGAEQFEQLSVPDWNKSATFLSDDAPRWWQWQGLPIASMTMSLVAMVMVVSGFHVEVSGSKLSMGFARVPDADAVAAIVDTRLETYQQSSQTLLTQYLDALNTQQQQNSAQLTQYLLSSSRKERREDFAELVKFINQQRTDDQRFVARQINHLQQEISAISTDYTVTNTPMELNDD
ncbi:hypothetical protein DXV75_04115 [Alteromonas aestuariivivens]|uniref:Uncharacterized protein n=1 Tax=Alteromonas aestuariivivens TaxID=1938339 RepID=A0A3D8MCY8_9ALTE|nr:hypothetical protein [Alteromonas aestuariivivens]RDV28155.1 hypothetical protein DXV75_04115 [Alteromonas aestuariivivens]